MKSVSLSLSARDAPKRKSKQRYLRMHFFSVGAITTTHSACNECNTSPGFFLRSFPSFVAFPPLSQAICNEKSHTSNTFSQCRVQCYGFKMQTVCCGLGTIVQHRIHELVTQTCNKRPCLSAACFVCVRAMRVCLVASLAWFWFRVT